MTDTQENWYDLRLLIDEKVKLTKFVFFPNSFILSTTKLGQTVSIQYSIFVNLSKLSIWKQIAVNLLNAPFNISVHFQ